MGGATLPARAATAGKPIVFGLFMDVGASQKAQYLHLFQSALKVFEQETGRHIELTHYLTHQDFLKGVENQTFDMAFATWGHAPPGYDVLMGVTAFGKSTFHHCLFVREDSPAQTPQDLRNKVIMTYPYAPTYYALRFMLQEPPENFFQQIRVSTSTASSFIPLSLGEIDGAFATDAEVDYTNLVNPGATAKLRTIACDNLELPFPPVIVRGDIPESLREQARKLLRGLHKNKNAREVGALMRAAKVKFIPFPEKARKGREARTREAEKNGWDNDFERWQRLSTGNYDGPLKE